MHGLKIEWGCITNLMDRICSIEEGVDGGWPELLDMVADAASSEGKADSTALFFNLYQFLFRLYCRLKRNSEKRPFNTVKKVGGSEGEAFLIQNFDYNMFKWLVASGFGDLITNDFASIPRDRLDDRQLRAFERRCPN